MCVCGHGSKVCHMCVCVCRYQRRRMYTRIALGKNSAMDVVSGESSGGQGQLLILYPLLFALQILEIYIGTHSLVLPRAYRKELVFAILPPFACWVPQHQSTQYLDMHSKMLNLWRVSCMLHASTDHAVIPLQFSHFTPCHPMLNTGFQAACS